MLAEGRSGRGSEVKMVAELVLEVGGGAGVVAEIGRCWKSVLELVLGVSAGSWRWSWCWKSMLEVLLESVLE